MIPFLMQHIWCTYLHIKKNVKYFDISSNSDLLKTKIWKNSIEEEENGKKGKGASYRML